MILSDSQIDSRPETWFKAISPQRPDARLRLFCFPFAGGGDGTYRLWRQEIDASTELFAVQLPGRGARIKDRARLSVDQLLAALTSAIDPLLDRPYALFGHSLGALVAFALCRRLEAGDARTPTLLVASGCAAPGTEIEKDPISQLPRAAFFEELKRLNGTPDEVLEHPEIMEFVEPMLRADFRLYEEITQLERTGTAVPILAFGGDEDPDVPEASMEAWRHFTSGPCAVHFFPGDHFFINDHWRDMLGTLLGAVVPSGAKTW